MAAVQDARLKSWWSGTRWASSHDSGQYSPGIGLNRSSSIGKTSMSSSTKSFKDPSHGHCTWKTLFSASKTFTDSLTVGVASCPPQTGFLCPHRHKEAEVYHIIEGAGTIHIDSVEQSVGPGSIIYIPGNAKHGIRNDDIELELKWLYVFRSGTALRWSSIDSDCEGTGLSVQSRFRKFSFLSRYRPPLPRGSPSESIIF